MGFKTVPFFMTKSKEKWGNYQKTTIILEVQIIIDECIYSTACLNAMLVIMYVF